MKITKRVFSIVLALVMVISCISVATITASAAESDYNSNIAVSYDQYCRDYSYGTDGASAWPRQITFDDKGWMRIQSQTAEEIANGEDGTYQLQWQFHMYPTPEYSEQFSNAIKAALNETGTINFYFYAKSGSAVIPSNNTYNDKATIDFSLTVNVKYDSDFDGYYESTLKLGQETNYSQVNTEYGFRYQNTSIPIDTFAQFIEYGIDFKLEDILIQPRSFEYSNEGNNWAANSKDEKGLGKLDVFVSPGYVYKLPGYENYNADNTIMFNAEEQIDAEQFTKGAINPDDWQWEDDDDAGLTVFKKGDIKRDKETKYPYKADGTTYSPIPFGFETEIKDAVCSNLKATSVTSNSATLTWTGENAVSYFVNESTGKFNKNVSTNTVTITGLSAGTTYQFRVRGINRASKNGKYTDYITVKTASAIVKPATPKMNTVKYVASGTNRVYWYAAKNAKAYRVYRKVNSGSWKYLGATTKTYYTDKKATTGGTYYYRVVAVNGTQKSSYSSYKYIKIMGVANKPVIKLSAGKKYLKVSFKTKVTNATGYRYEYSLYSNMKSKKTSTSATIKGLKSGKYYYVRSRAYKKVGSKVYWSKYSSVVKVKVK